MILYACDEFIIVSIIFNHDNLKSKNWIYSYIFFLKASTMSEEDEYLSEEEEGWYCMQMYMYIIILNEMDTCNPVKRSFLSFFHEYSNQ